MTHLSAAAQAWRAGGRTMRIDGMDVFVRTANEEAKGTPLLLLHGFPSSSYDFHLCWEALAAGRRVVTLDYPGYGFSAKPADHTYSLFEQADAVEQVLRAEGINRCDLAAHDVGTSVTTELLARRAAGLLHFEIDRLVLLNGSVYIALAQLSISQKLLRAPLVGKLFARLANRATFGRQLRRICARPLADSELDDMFALIRLDDGHLRLPTLIGYIDERWRFQRRWLQPLRSFDRPTLVLWGLRDPIAVPAIGERLAAEIPGARKVELPDVGHYPTLEDPDRVSREIVEFLRR